MSSATYFVQDCPVCGRFLQVRLELLGKSVACRHCQGVFMARDPSTAPRRTADSGNGIMERVNELLSSVDALRPRPR